MIFLLFGLAVLALFERKSSASARTLSSGGGPVFPVHPAFPQSVALGLVDACIRQRAQPTPEVTRQAIADAFAAQRPDVAAWLYRVFVAPSEIAIARDANPVLFVPPPAPPPAPSPAPTITVSGRSSPIEGVSNERWAEFVATLEREAPDFDDGRRVGRYSSRKDRLVEVGASTAIAGDADAQYGALCAELSDAYKHARASGMLERVNEFVDVPTDRGVQKLPVTLSGMLGVIQGAGLEGAASWLDSPDDRKKFKGTTAQFMRTNGVF